MLKRILLYLLLLLPGVPSLAEVELHVVGVYAGHRALLTRKGTREVQVALDRPGAQVVLVLSSYEGVDWQVSTAPGTAPPALVLSQISKQDQESTIHLNGALAPNPRRVTLPLTWRPEGDDFRALVSLVPQRFGVERMASYVGSYNAPEEGFVVDQLVADERYALDYLRPKLAKIQLRDALRNLLPPRPQDAPPPVALTDRGFVLAGADGRTTTIPLPPGMPEVSWPVAAVRDDQAGLLYGTALGGEGLIYACDEGQGTWRILRGLDGLDPGGMILDPLGRRLILTASRYQKQGLLLAHDLSAPDAAPLVQLADLADLPGLADLYDPDNGPVAVLVPVGIEGNRVLLDSTGPMFPRLPPVSGEPPWRAYLVDLTTGQADLVGYEGGISGE